MEDKEANPEAIAQVHLITDQKTRIRTTEIITIMMTSQINSLEIKIIHTETQEILKMKETDRACTQARATEETMKPEIPDLEATIQATYALQMT